MNWYRGYDLGLEGAEGYACLSVITPIGISRPSRLGSTGNPHNACKQAQIGNWLPLHVEEVRWFPALIAKRMFNSCVAELGRRSHTCLIGAWYDVSASSMVQIIDDVTAREPGVIAMTHEQFFAHLDLQHESYISRELAKLGSLD